MFGFCTAMWALSDYISAGKDDHYNREVSLNVCQKGYLLKKGDYPVATKFGRIPKNGEKLA